MRTVMFTLLIVVLAAGVIWGYLTGSVVPDAESASIEAAKQATTATHTENNRASGCCRFSKGFH
eukprot:Nk52_evm13s2426 gene=Nk52_evmTU13s2426